MPNVSICFYVSSNSVLNASKSLINSEQLPEVGREEGLAGWGWFFRGKKRAFHGRGGQLKLRLQIQYKTRQTEETEAHGTGQSGSGSNWQHGAKMETMDFGVFEQRLVPGRWSHGNQLFTFRARFCFAVSALAPIFGAFLPLLRAGYSSAPPWLLLGFSSLASPRTASKFLGGTKTKPSMANLWSCNEAAAEDEDEAEIERGRTRILRPGIGHDPATTVRTSGHW